MLKLGSLFSGCGGLDLAFIDHGFELAFMAEVDRNASAVLRRHHPDVLNVGDVKLLRAECLPKVDLLTFGSPCQDISRANTKSTHGLHDRRSGLIWQVVRLVAEMRREGNLPKLLVWENVDALTGPKWRDQYGEVLSAFRNHGYHHQTYVEMALDAGVPQLRKRTVTVLSQDELTFPLTAGRRGQVTTISDILESELDDEFTPKLRSQLLKQLYGQRLGDVVRERTLRVQQVEAWLGMHPGREPIEWAGKCVCYSPTYTCTPQVERMSTLTKQDTPWVLLPSGVRRRLTITELERAFGLPDGHTATGVLPDGRDYNLTDLQRRGLLGNAVVPAAVDGIARWASEMMK